MSTLTAIACPEPNDDWTSTVPAWAGMQLDKTRSARGWRARYQFMVVGNGADQGDVVVSLAYPPSLQHLWKD